MTKKNLHIISVSFPLGIEEQFCENEINELSKYFDKIIIYPMVAEQGQRNLASNISIDLALTTASRKISLFYYLKNLPFVLSVLISEFFNTPKKKAIFKNSRELANSILQCKKLSEILISKIPSNEENYFYSIWMNDGALILAIMAHQKRIKNFLFRVNGFDLFDERRKDGLMPFRHFNHKYAKNVVAVSELAASYLKEKNLFPEKIFLNYHATADNGENPFCISGIFTLVSCARVVPLKRIDKIIDALQHINFPVKWVHFGGGELLNKMVDDAKSLPKNIYVDFRGSVSNDLIMEFYKTQSVNLFIHLSDTEGFGYSIVEAQSFGIPALATAVGGVVNIVNEKTGILVSADDNSKFVSSKIYEFANSEKNTLFYRKMVKEHWNQKFNATTNYKSLADKILE